MNRGLQNTINKYAGEHKSKKRWIAAVVSLGAAVALGTSYLLINPATTKVQKTYCGLEEHIEHTDACYEKVLVCRLSEEGHTHSETCYEAQQVLICSLPETDGHTHSDECFGTEKYLFCGLEETDGHRHGEGCFETKRVLVCDNTDEGHEHTDECYADDCVLTCRLEECEPHHHDENCYSSREVLICNKEEAAPHHHDENCYETQTVRTCGLEESGPHQHSEECYAINHEHLLCELPVHRHTLQCFSDPEADHETVSVWELTFRDAKLTGKWNEDVLAIARTQLGYTESTANYKVQEDGTTMKGYTRYGDWYGNSYGDWCAMFCSFCMNYAGVDSDLISFDDGCQTWADKLNSEEYGLYHAAGTCYIPAPGDLVFFDLDESDGNRHADHIGFVAELMYDQESKELTGITTIEGDSGNQVRVNSYEIDCEDIMGYGEMPRNPEWFALEAVTDTGIQVTVEGLRSSLPYPEAEIVLSAKEIVSEESAALLASQMEADGVEDMDSILMDISLRHDDGIVEPIGPVYLSFATKDVDIDSTVYHIDEENETVTEMPAEVNEFENTVSLETEHFSVFALTLRAKAGKNVTATVEADWDDETNVLSSVVLKTKSSAQICHNYDVFNGSSWTIGAGTWTTKVNANAEQTFDITALVNSSTLSTRYRARVAENTGNPENDKSGYSEEFSLYDILEAAKPGFTDWVSGTYSEFFGGVRPTNAAQLFAAFDVYYDLPSLTLEKHFDNGFLTVTAATDAAFEGTYVWQYYDDATGRWITLAGEDSNTLNATNYSKLTQGAQPLLDGGKKIRCQLLDGDTVKAVATIDNVNPLKEVYDAAIININSGLGLNAYRWYLNGVAKTANVEIGSTAFMDYFYYDNVARDPDVPFFDGESYSNYLAAEYLRVKETYDESAALEHVAAIWDKYIFDIYNPNPGAGVVDHYSYYPGANANVDPDRISTYGDKIIEWPKDNASSFHNPKTGVARNGEDGLINSLAYDFLEGGVDYSRFIQSLDKTATADAAGDFNEDRTYDIDITAKTQATSVSPLAMLITVQTSWQMFDYPHANCVAGDGTYTSIEVGGAQRNTEMANLYDIKQAILRFVDWMDDNFPGHNLVLGINEVQHGGSYNLINYNVGGNNKNANIIYVSNNSDLLHESLYNWDTFGNCEHVHYDTNAMEDAAEALQANLTGWVDVNGDPIQFTDINKVAVIIGGGTENTNGTNGYGCALPWGTFYSSSIDAVYGIRTNVGTPLNTDGVLSWLDYYKNNTGNPYSLTGAGYSSGSATGNFTEKYVAPNEDALFNYLVKIAQQELKSKGVKVQDESKSIDNVTISDTVNDEFRIEENKPFTATVLNKNGNKVYETVITPTAYTAVGEITNATATFTVFNSDGTVSTTTPTVTVAQNGTETTLSVPVDIPYSYMPAGAEAVQQSGTVPYTQTLKINGKSDNTTDVSFDFGTVYNTNDAKLHFEVIARDDYIGSNNVFTNEGTPEVSFKHVKLDRKGDVYIDPDTGAKVIVSDVVEGYDTPEVNVPIRFTADNGGSIKVEVKTPVNLEDLSTTEGGTNSQLPGSYTGSETDIADSEYITATVHDLIDNYDQINGTVSYTWVIPGGKEYPVPVTLHVTNGDPDGDITAASEMAQKWTPKTSGIYDVVLKVTFTPDPVEDKGNFADDGGVTATRVTKLQREGHETVYVSSASGDISESTELTVTKVWSGEKGNIQNRPGSITFNVFQDGEFYDQKTVTADEQGNWSCTFTNVPYRDPDNLSHIYTYTVTEDNVPNYMTSYGDMQTVQPVPYYWVEVPMEDVDLTGETEYMIVDKSTGVAINADSNNKTPEVDLHTAADGEYPAAVDGASSYFPDDGYLGWHIKYTNGSTNADNYIESASEDTTLYLKKDASYANATNNDTRLELNPTTDGKIKLNGKYLRIKVDNNGNISIANDGTAANFTFYETVKNTALPTYRTAVTNTYIPGGERPNETSVTVNKEWIKTDTTTEIVINLLQNGRVIDTCTLNSTTGWTHTFSTLPGTDTKLPYFDPLTGEVYEYTVEEEVVSGYETGYKKTMVSDPGGGTHWILFNESSIPASTDLWTGTTYALVTRLTTGKGANAETKDYLIGCSGSGFTKALASVTEADDPSTAETETFTFGSLTCSEEYTGTVPASAVWTVEPIADTQYYRLKVNGLYLGLKDDGKNFTFVSTATDKNPCCNFGFEYTSNGSGKLYGLKKNDPGQIKYLKLTVDDKGTLKAEASDANAAVTFTVFEQVSLQSKFDTYSYSVQNISTEESSADGLVKYRKYIDYLADNFENSVTANPDTDLRGDHYRLYLDAVGTRVEGSADYPELKGVYITDHLSKYVTLADNGNNMALSINKVSVSDPEDITYLWYGNLNAADGSIGAPLADGISVIRSVVYTKAEDDDPDSTTGMIRVDFEPEYCLEEGYKYVVSYNVEGTDLAKEDTDYPHVGDLKTDYPGNITSSGKPGYKSNSFADVVYTQNGDVKIGIYDHPVIQAKVHDVIEPEQPPRITLPTIDGTGATLEKQIDWLGDTMPGMDELYRLYLNLDVDAWPIDLLLVIDESGSMEDDIDGNKERLEPTDEEWENIPDPWEEWEEYDDETGLPVPPDDWWVYDEVTGEWNAPSAWEYDEDMGWYYAGELNPDFDKSRIDIISDFLNGTVSDHSDGFIYNFLNDGADNKLAVMTFSDTSTIDENYIRKWNDETYSVRLDEPYGSTNYMAALEVADQIWDQHPDNGHQKIMIFLSDGVPTVAYRDGQLHSAGERSRIGYGSEYNTYDSILKAFEAYLGAAYWDANDEYLNAAYWDANDGQTDYWRDFYSDGRTASVTYNESARDTFPVVIDIHDVVIQGIPGIVEYPFGDFINNGEEFINWYEEEWGGNDEHPGSMTDADKLAWLQDHVLSLGEYYDLFWLSERCFADFVKSNSEVVTYSIGFSSNMNGYLDNGRDKAEVLRYMAGSDNYFYCADKQSLTSVLNKITGIKGISITDELSEYVELADEPAGGPNLRIDMRIGEGSSAVPYPLYADGNFTEHGETYLDQNRTGFDQDGTLHVVFKPDVTFFDRFYCEASFNVQLTEAAYEEWAENGYTVTGDPNTDYGENDTSSGKPGLFSNDDATAEWDHDGEHSEDYPDPVVQVIEKQSIWLVKSGMEDRTLVLSGAGFDLYMDCDEDTAGAVAIPGLDGKYGVKVNTETLVTKPTAEGGKLEIPNLALGHYYLVETETPNGFNSLEAPVEFDLSYDKISTESKYAFVTDEEPLLITVLNEGGYELPETGGTGTILYTLSGLILMVSTLMYGYMLRRERERRANQ